jgi:eukaryotic-like serine/threonine-protein kinase
MLVPSDPNQGQMLAAVAESFGPALGLPPRQMVNTALEARATLAQLAAAMNLNVAADAPARRLLQATEAPAAAPVQASPSEDRTLVVPPAAAGAAQQQLANGLNRVRSAVAQRTMPLNDLLRLLLQTLHESLALQRVVLCIRDPRSGALLGRVGVGERAMELATAFHIQPDERAVNDLFAALTAKGADLLVADAAAMSKRLPAWYRQRVNAATFLLLPMMIKGTQQPQPIGLLYADKAEAGSLKVGEGELALLRSLRDEAVAAFAGGR